MGLSAAKENSNSLTSPFLHKSQTHFKPVQALLPETNKKAFLSGVNHTHCQEGSMAFSLPPSRAVVVTLDLS
jgi:hypothetical protein